MRKSLRPAQHHLSERTSRAGRLGAGAMLLFASFLAFADLGNYVIKNFSAVMENHKAPYETQIKTLLEGDEAEPKSGGQVLIRGLKLQTFSETGEVQMTVKAPECIFNASRKTVHSAGPFEAFTGDGRFSFAGEGFLWQQTNNVLIISNRVQTEIRSESKKASLK
ncbi:MAG: hypothetical protein U1F65_10920 [Verrucomicrobiota bacterium]